MVVNFILSIGSVVEDILRLIGRSTHPMVVVPLCFALIVAIIIHGTSKDKSTKEEDDKKDDVFVSENKELLAKNKIPQVINNLLRYEYQEEDKQIKDEIIIISARYQQEMSNDRKGIGVDNQNIARIMTALVDILNSMQKNEILKEYK